MDVPDWIVDDILAGAKPTAVRLTILLLRRGSPQVDRNGNRRIYWRGPLQSLARIVGCSKRSLLDAEHELVDIGFLTVHGKIFHNAIHALSVPLSRPQRGANFASPAEPENRTHGGGAGWGNAQAEEDEIFEADPRTTTSAPAPGQALSTDPGGEIFSRLVAFGVDAAAARLWLRVYGDAMCAEACGRLDNRLDLECETDYLRAAGTGWPHGEHREIDGELVYVKRGASWRSQRIKNPAGLLHTFVTTRRAAPPEHGRDLPLSRWEPLLVLDAANRHEDCGGPRRTASPRPRQGRPGERTPHPCRR
jgi:hypothetical protein